MDRASALQEYGQNRIADFRIKCRRCQGEADSPFGGDQPGTQATSGGPRICASKDVKGESMKKITAKEPEVHSADIVTENLDYLKALFPAAFTEGKIDFEVLKQLLGGTVDEREEKYGLNWHGKRQARQLALTPSTGTLRPLPRGRA